MNNINCHIKNERIYFCQKNIPSKKQVLKRIGVKKNTFAGNIVSRIYDYYFQGAVNFRKEYTKYYRDEFSSLDKFIQEHFNIESDDAIKMAVDNYSMKDYSIYSIDRTIEEIINYDESFINAFYKAIGGVQIEN